MNGLPQCLVAALTCSSAADGLTFDEILDQLRSDLAARYLEERNLATAQIAWLVGYGGVSAFTGACKRWTGETPGQIRGALRG